MSMAAQAAIRSLVTATTTLFGVVSVMTPSTARAEMIRLIIHMFCQVQAALPFR
jgi:hypothetical protein